MTYEQFKNEIIQFFKNINQMALLDYSDELSEEKLQVLQNFDSDNIVFNNANSTTIDSNKLYINNSYFFSNGSYDIGKFEELKKKFLEKYFEKFIVFNYNEDANSLMMKYSVEDETNKFITNHSLNIAKTNNYQNEYILTLIKNKAGIYYSEILGKKDVSTLLDSIKDEKIKNEYLKLIDPQNNKTIHTDSSKEESIKENEEEEIAKVYGIDLTDIEVINIKNKKYYKIKKDSNYFMVEANTNYSMIQEFKNYQEEYEAYQTPDSKKNTANIADDMLNNKIEVKLLPINDLPSYRNVLMTLSPEQIARVQVLFSNRENCHLSLINIYDGIAIDSAGKCVFVERNDETKQYEIKYAETNVYNENQVKSTSSDSNNQITDGVNTDDLNTDEMEITDAIDNSHEIQHEERHGYQKRLTLLNNPPRQAGFIDALILALITGFVSGLIIGILLILMQ